MSLRDDRSAAPAHVYENSFFEYCMNELKDAFHNILLKPIEYGHYPLDIEFLELNDFCSQISNDILLFPSVILPACDRAATHALTTHYDNANDKTNLNKRKYVHPRFHSMPHCWDRYMEKFPGVEELGRYFAVVGTVVRCSPVKVLEFSKFYQCTQCKHIMVYEAHPSRCHTFPRYLDKCKNLCVGGKVEVCASKNSNTDHFRFRDYQEAKIQESVTQMEFGIMPKTLVVILENDLVNSMKPGDDVEITGVLFHRCRPFRTGKEIQAELAFRANFVEVLNATENLVTINTEVEQSFETFWRAFEYNPFAGRNVIIKSVCPELYGMYTVKLSLMVTLAGGVAKQNSDFTVRGESHLLLSGDAGTGKSQLLTYATKLVPRAIMTNGTGATAAGLTVAAIKDGGDWNLEAGALVMADGGLCCIDEFTNIKEQDRTCIHEAMEQQTISVAKGGIVCKLNTKCTVLAATNPDAHSSKRERSSVFDKDANYGLASPLLSRFDLVVMLKDTSNSVWDELLTDFILEDDDPYKDCRSGKNDAMWDINKLRTYLVLIKDQKKPELTEEVCQVLGEYYQRQRLSDHRNKARTSFRLMESLYRLTEGHAKLMYRNKTELHDAITAIALVESSMMSSAVLNKSIPNPMHSAFPDDPMFEYYKQAKLILKGLGLPGLWDKEKAYLQSIGQKGQSPQNPPSGADSG